jgi:GT2 family glycosyltransferase
MTVYVLMPVFNRAEMTESMLKCLHAQQLDEPLTIIVVDDGSTDGTAELLRQHADVNVLKGDGSLWWGGAIDLGLRYIFTRATADDWILFVNNDTVIDTNFVQTLLSTAREHAPAAVGSVIRDIDAPHSLLSVGPKINAWRFRVSDAIDALSKNQISAGGVVNVDALSGRGVLFPVAALRAVDGLRPGWLPHYLADYEVAARVRRAGWRLIVNMGSPVYSKHEYGNSFRSTTLRERLFSPRSPAYLPARFLFWWSASNILQRITFPLRAAGYILVAAIRAKT